MNFDRYAKNWDTDFRINRAKEIANEIESTIDCNKNDAAMEFGCGTGLISFNLIDRFKSITLIDSSGGMIDILNNKIAKFDIKNMSTYHLDITADAKPDSRYDVIYTSMVLHHIEDTRDIIKQFYTLLNDKGQLCIIDLNKEDGRFHKNRREFKGHNGFDQAELKRILLDTGFENVETRTFFHGEKKIEDETVEYSLFIMKAQKV